MISLEKLPQVYKLVEKVPQQYTQKRVDSLLPLLHSLEDAPWRLANEPYTMLNTFGLNSALITSVILFFLQVHRGGGSNTVCVFIL